MTEKYLLKNKTNLRIFRHKTLNFYLAQYWAKALANQNEDQELKEKFSPIAKALQENEAKILQEIADAEGKPVDLGGYYLPDDNKAEKAMRPSKTLNEIIDNI